MSNSEIRDAGQEGTAEQVPMQTRMSRACVAAANELNELYEIAYEADPVADVIYKHIRQVLMEDYDAARHVPLSAPVPPDEITTRCVECESVHFNVKWSVFQHLWQICCEGCGCIHQLIPTGSIQLRRKA